MVTFYVAEKDKLSVVHPDNATAAVSRLAWIDLYNPSNEEELHVEELLGIEIPTRAEMHEIELSNRLYEKRGVLYLTATIITGADTDHPEAHAITFVLGNNYVVTVRYSNPTFFGAYAERMQKGSMVHPHGRAVLIGLLEAIIDRIADILEMIAHRIDTIAGNIFRASSKDAAAAEAMQPDFGAALNQIGANGDLISKMRESLISISRLASFLASSGGFLAASPEHAKLEIVRHDIPALSDHAGFLSSKVNFLLDATLGMVSIQQNNIIKIFSVAAVVFLPPTLVASIYGMNFAFIPELHWEYGYPMAILLMILSALLPYAFFRKKGWL